MSKSYKLSLLQSKTNKLFKENVYQINNKKKDSVLDYDDIRKIHKNLQDKIGDNDRVIIRGLSPIGWTTLTTKDGELNLKNEADYFDGKVKQPNKFHSFFQIQIHVIKGR
jgi:hypothetical protein